MLRRIFRHEPPVWLLVTAIIFFISIISISVLTWIFESSYKNKTYPGVFIGELNVGGLTEDELTNKVNNRIDEFAKSGVIFTYKNKQATLYPAIASTDGDFIKNIIDFDRDKIISTAMTFGRDGNFASNFANQVKALITNTIIEPSYVINDSDISDFLKTNFRNELAKSTDAKISFYNNQFSITPEKYGIGLNTAAAIKALDDNIIKFSNQKIVLSETDEQPKIKQTDLESNLAIANEYLNLAPLTLTYKTKKWSVGKEELGKWLAFYAKDNSGLQLMLDSSSTERYLTEKVNPKIEIKMTDARFELKNGKTVAFSTARDGLAVNATATIAKIEQDFIDNKKTSIEIEVQKVQSTVSSSTDAAELGIKEIIGTGVSNFAGSPKNRRTNIRVGMSYLNGLLIAPGETFSVMKHLGHIDETKGYLEELVIKGNETKKEFGGGLCQIGTTVFRAALNSGLPINERRNHSYRVAYYEPAGTDATIYDPSPDLKFTNDTSHYVLIQGRMSGNTLTFDFWGTRDGRKAVQTYPVISNIVKPAPAKLVETLTLPVGQKKCTEHAHNGADTTFNYTVTYNDGAVKNKKFSSHYVPWQEVCLIGVSKLSPISSTTTELLPTENNTTTATPTTTTKIIPTKATTTTKKIEPPVAATTKENISTTTKK